MTKLIPSLHPGEDAFEDYAFNRLSEKETAVFEEHLLICEKCQQTQAEADTYVCLMKAAAAAYVIESSRERARDHRRSSPPVRIHALRKNAPATAVLLVTCLTALLSWKTTARTTVGDPRSIELNAYRGAISHAPARQALDLKIDLNDLPQAVGYRIEVVDTSGRRVWGGLAPARLVNGLPAGIYWVRLWSDTGEWLREYGLNIQ